MNIIQYNSICNLGNNIDEIFDKALSGNSDCFELCHDIIAEKIVRFGQIKKELSKIDDKDFDIRCNRLILECAKLLDIRNIITTYGAENVAVVVATSNSGVEEYSNTKNSIHFKFGNPALFAKKFWGLKNYAATVSTACSSGIKAFSLAKNLLQTDYAKAVIVIGVDAFSKVPIFGFDSLGVLSAEPSIPFSENRTGMNISEAVSIFVVSNIFDSKIKICGISENTDTYHSTTPNPDAVQEIKLINDVLKFADLTPSDIGYINLHGTGTPANDIMEANAIHNVFGNSVFASSTKPLTGHCLGAAGTLELALCCKLLEQDLGNFKLYPHVYDGHYDKNLPEIKLVQKNTKLLELKNILNLSFGFGGTNTAMIIRRCDHA